MAEKLGVEIRDLVIQKFLKQLTKRQPDLYYAATALIARAIHKDIQNKLNTLPFEGQVLVRA